MKARTPGPWRSMRYDEGWFVIETDAGDEIGEQVANVDSEDDARLIAAAPDLLSEIQNMLTLVRLKYGNLDPDANTLMDRAEAAIAKATGAPA